MTVSPKELMNMVVTAADDKKASNIVALDLNNISLVADLPREFRYSGAGNCNRDSQTGSRSWCDN